MGKQSKQWQTLFSWAPKSLQMVTVAVKLKDACFLEEKLWQTLDSVLKSRGITLPTKVRIGKAESWTIKKTEHLITNAFELWCWRRLLRVSWTARRSNQSIQKEISSGCSWEGWSWNSNTWPLDVKNWLIGKDPDAGKDWRQEEKGMTEDEMVGWHHWFNGHEFGQTLGDSEVQGNLVCCSPWGR